MKGYNIDFAAGCITVTKSFNAAAGKIGSNAFKTMMTLRELDLPIRVISNPRKQSPHLSYRQMLKHIECMADAEAYKEEFEAVRKVSLGEKNSYQYVLRWYEERFPTHNAVPEFDENYKLINTPNNYAA